MTWQDQVDAWFPPLTLEGSQARNDRLEGVYTRAGYRSLDMGRVVASMVDEAVEAAHQKVTPPAPVRQAESITLTAG